MTTQAEMVDLIRARGVSDPRVLAAIARVPREGFVPEDQRSRAFDDRPLPIGENQTISQPYMVASMAEAARIRPTDRVLEIGTGSGYGAAVLAELAAEVVSVEVRPTLAEAARKRLTALGCDRVQVVVGDGSEGWPAAEPYDAIVVTAGAPEVPEPLKAQLAVGGRLIVPVGGSLRHLRLLRLTREAQGFTEDDLGLVSFVPLIGRYGFAD